MYSACSPDAEPAICCGASVMFGCLLSHSTTLGNARNAESGTSMYCFSVAQRDVAQPGADPPSPGSPRSSDPPGIASNEYE